MTPDDGPLKDSIWYADDFETTTDLDGPIEPYTPTADELAENADLGLGESRLRVVAGRKGVATRTITYLQTESGLTATTRSGRVRVWSWAIAPIGQTVIYRGQDIADYVELAAQLGGIHWFHNLRFDAAFLDTYLQAEFPEGLGMIAGTWPKRYTPPGAFGALISDQGAHYSRNVHLSDGRKFEVRDSLKKFPATSVAQLAVMFGAPDPKGEIDYDAPRPKGYRPTPEEWAYLETDVEIVRTALKVAQDAGAEGLTVGGDALHEYKMSRERIKGHKQFRVTFPLLPKQMDDFIRRALRGGWTYVNPLWQREVLTFMTPAVRALVPGLCEGDPIGSTEDVNSMYPAVMYQEAYPVGMPAWMAPGQLKIKGRPHTIVGAMFDAEIKPGKLPIIQVKGDPRYSPTMYQTSVHAVEWYGTEVDWALLEENYTVVVHEWLGGLAFHSKRGLFKDYIDKWMGVKEKAGRIMTDEKRAGREGSRAYREALGQRTQAKFALNNLWGRFSINPLRGGKTPGLAFDGTPTYETGAIEYDEPCYTAVGVWTTSYGRDRVIRAAQQFGDLFLSADTDSVHHLGLETMSLEMHDTKLGAWKREEEFTKASYLRAKAYAEEIHGEVQSHVAGLPRKLLGGMRVEDLIVGAKFSGKLVPRRVPGGVILESTDFIIGEKDAWGNR